MYDLNYTFLTELEVDTRQSFDDLSDDLLLLDKNAEESQVVDMKSVISSWQNYFWKSPNANKQRLDMTFTDISIYRGSVASTDYQGNPLNDLEMMSVEELNSFFHNLDDISAWAGGRTWAQLSNALCNAINALQRNYVDANNVYPKHSLLVTDENPNNRGFGSWTANDNCYLAERFAKANYDLSAGLNHGCGSLNAAELPSAASNPPAHTHKLKFMPESGSGGSESSGACSGNGAYPQFQWFNKRRGLSAPGNRGDRCNWFSGKWASGPNNLGLAVRTDVCAGPLPCAEGDQSADFAVSASGKNAIDSSIKIAPKTHPLTATLWERTGD